MIFQCTLFRLWKAANNEDRSGSEERAVPAYREHYEELKKANKELWRRVEELQQENASVNRQNQELQQKKEYVEYEGKLHF